MTPAQPFHATLIADFISGRWSGALIRGPSGSGKSTTALRCIAAGFRLVADDRVVLWRSGSRLFGKAPKPLAGRLEVRGVGIGFEAAIPFSEVVLAVDLAEPNRMPDPLTAEIASVQIPLYALSLTDGDLPLRLRAALRRHL